MKTDPKQLIAGILRGGLVLALVLLMIGVVLAALGKGTPLPHEIMVKDMPRALWHLEAGGFFSLGLLLLVLTQAVCVLALLAFYLRKRKWLFAGISFAVICGLVLSGVVGLLAS